MIDWGPRHLYRKLFAGDAAAMEYFLATVCTHEWNRRQDAGRSFAEGARLLKAEHPDQIAAITALILLVPSIAFMQLLERFLNTEMLAKNGLIRS